MPVNLSIKNAPDDVVERLRQRAAKNHRSLQGELLAIIETATLTPKHSPAEILARIKGLGIETPANSVEIIRAARDGDYDLDAQPASMTPKQFLARVRELELRTASESVDMIRADRERDESR